MAQLHDPNQRDFASDNYAHFGPATETFPVFNGTGANVTALTSLLPRWGAVITAKSAHINVDENGAPERVSGLKLSPSPPPTANSRPTSSTEEAWGWGDEHRAQPLAVSIANTTELGTLYSVDEIRAIAEHAHEKGMLVHMDGARISNAAAALDVPLREFTSDVEVDILSFGGTKNGLQYGEAIVVLNQTASDGLLFLRKLTMQLASKMRFVSAQFLALMTDDLYLRSARHANAMAARLRSSWRSVTFQDSSSPRRPKSTSSSPSCHPEQPTNSERVSRSTTGTRPPEKVGWMASFDTTEQDVVGFVDAMTTALLRP